MIPKRKFPQLARFLEKCYDSSDPITVFSVKVQSGFNFSDGSCLTYVIRWNINGEPGGTSSIPVSRVQMIPLDEPLLYIGII